MHADTQAGAARIPASSVGAPHPALSTLLLCKEGALSAAHSPLPAGSANLPSGQRKAVSREATSTGKEGGGGAAPSCWMDHTHTHTHTQPPRLRTALSLSGCPRPPCESDLNFVIKERHSVIHPVPHAEFWGWPWPSGAHREATCGCAREVLIYPGFSELAQLDSRAIFALKKYIHQLQRSRSSDPKHICAATQCSGQANTAPTPS